MDGTVHTTAAQQQRIGSVHDGIDVERGDIGLDDGDLRLHQSLLRTQLGNSLWNRSPADPRRVKDEARRPCTPRFWITPGKFKFNQGDRSLAGCVELRLNVSFIPGSYPGHRPLQLRFPIGSGSTERQKTYPRL